MIFFFFLDATFKKVVWVGHLKYIISGGAWEAQSAKRLPLTQDMIPVLGSSPTSGSQLRGESALPLPPFMPSSVSQINK